MLFANSQNQPLAQHSYAVARLAVEMFLSFNFKDAVNSNLGEIGIDNIEKLQQKIFLAALFHDFGKVDNNFQRFLVKKKVSGLQPGAFDGVHIEVPKTSKSDAHFSFSSYPRHNEVSWALFLSIFNWSPTNEFLRSVALLQNDIAYGIYFHHESVRRTETFDSQKILRMVTNLAPSGPDLFSSPSNNLLATATSLLRDIQGLAIADQSLPPSFKNLLHGFSQSLLDRDGYHYALSSSKTDKIPSFLFSEPSDLNATQPLTLADFKVEQEAHRFLLRSLVISADRIVSGLSAPALQDIINDSSYSGLVSANLANVSIDLISAVSLMEEKFACQNENSKLNQERDRQQDEVATKLSQVTSPSVLFGPAGCGKTKIFLQWAKKVFQADPSASQLIIIAPRQTVCLSLYEEITKDYLPNLSVELILGNDKRRHLEGQSEIALFQGSEIFTSDIVITTIDQLTSIMMSHKKINVLLSVLRSTLVFDEFHEFFELPGIVLLFKAIVYLKSLLSPAKTLLVSATPNFYFLEQVLGLSTPRCVVEIPTFNQADFQISFSFYKISQDKSQADRHKMLLPQPNGAVVVFNTAHESQKSSLAMDQTGQEKVINFHSKFTPKDKTILFSAILAQWGKKAVLAQKISSSVLRSGPILQASLNISTSYLLTQPCSAENWCQRLGRVNRFGLTEQLGVMETVAPEYFISGTSGFGNHGVIKFLQVIHAKNRVISWLGFVNFLHNSPPTKLKDIYDIYRSYHDKKTTQEAYRLDFAEILQASKKVFQENKFTPYFFPRLSSKSTSKIKKLPFVSLRGNSVFVLPVKFNIDTNVAEWLYVPSSNSTLEDSITVAQENTNLSVLSSFHIKYISSKPSLFTTYLPYSKKLLHPEKMVSKDAHSPITPVLVSFPIDNNFSRELNSAYSLVYLCTNNVLLGLYQMDLSTIHHSGCFSSSPSVF